MNNAELYNEELLVKQQQIIEALSSLVPALQAVADKIQPPVEEVTVKNSIRLADNAVEVTNLEALETKVDSLGGTITKAIENNRPEPLDAVTVKNPVDTVTVKNIHVLTEAIKGLESSLNNLNPQVTVEKQDIKLPKTARDYISVRLTDGAQFYKATAALASAVERLPLVTSLETGKLVLAVGNADGSMIRGGAAAADTSLIVNGADISTSSDSPSLAQAHTLAVDGADISTSAESPTLSLTAEDALLLESGDYLLLENNDKLLLE